MSKIIPTPEWIFSDWCCACGTNQGKIHTYYFRGINYFTGNYTMTDIMLCESCANRINKKTICKRFFLDQTKKLEVYYYDEKQNKVIIWEGVPCSV